MPANYNNSAWFYDTLSRIVYGRAVINAQIYLLQFIPANTNILIVGGGTGWILEKITARRNKGLQITYVEIAENMMSLSKRRNTGENTVIFINDAIENVTLTADFDIVLTPFLFDNFIPKTLQNIFAHVHPALKPGGLWLNCDFQCTGKWWQKVLLRLMFLFFRAICGIEAKGLPATDQEFERYTYQVISQQAFYGDFIISTAYKAP